MDPSLTGLRVLRAIAERGTFTAAAAELGYTQPAVSRQVAALEREAGTRLFERRPGGVRLTSAGLTLLRHARVVLDEIAAAERELSGAVPARPLVRLGVYISAGVDLLPRALATLRRGHPQIRVTSREGTTPALVRALRAGTLDLAVVTSRPPYPALDTELPWLTTTVLAEVGLLIAVAESGPFAAHESVTVEELADVDWIASPFTGSERLLGVWPGLAGRPHIAHSARDWLTKLQLVKAGCGVTTVPASLAATMPAGVRLIRVEGTPPELRRMIVARMPGNPLPSIVQVIQTLRGCAADLAP
jgi:DNA-binding transcriptional LysR family regulator